MKKLNELPKGALFYYEGKQYVKRLELGTGRTSCIIIGGIHTELDDNTPVEWNGDVWPLVTIH